MSVAMIFNNQSFSRNRLTIKFIDLCASALTRKKNSIASKEFLYLSIACQADILVSLDCVVKCILHLLELFSKLGHVLCYPCRILFVYHNALDKISNLFHLTFLHTKARCLRYSYSYATRVHIVSACLDVTRQ